MDDVYTFIGPAAGGGQGLAGVPTAWSLTRRRDTDAPLTDQLVVVSEDGGPPPEIKTAGGIGSAALRDSGVLVTIRGKAWDSDASMVKATAIHTALHGLRNATVGATLYYRVRALTPEPIFAGFDSTGRPRHTVGFRLLAAQT